MFWTNVEQAQQRLNSTWVLYGNSPFYVRDVVEENGEPFAYGYQGDDVDKRGTYSLFSLEKEEWNNFRNLPPTGWFNYINPRDNRLNSVYLNRLELITRRHGLCLDNSTVVGFIADQDLIGTQRGLSLKGLMWNPGYHNYIQEKEESYPSLSLVLQSILPRQSLAFSNKYTVYRDKEGMRWLYRRTTRIGLFTGVNTLVLFSSKIYLQEEIQNLLKFDIETVKEF